MDSERGLVGVHRAGVIEDAGGVKGGVLGLDILDCQGVAPVGLCDFIGRLDGDLLVVDEPADLGLRLAGGHLKAECGVGAFRGCHV